MTVMAETTFGVKYEGPVLADGRMAVRDLAPALLALGELFTEASNTLHPDRPPVTLDIHATHEGSFDIDLILHAVDGAWETTEQLFGSDGVSALVNLRDLILGGTGGGTIGLIEFIKWLRGRGVETAEPVDESSPQVATADPQAMKVTPVGGDGQALEIPYEVFRLHESVTIRTKAREIVKPVQRDGVDSFTAQRDEEVTVSVGKNDLPAFDAIEPVEDEEELPDTERAAIVQISGINWGGKWRFTEGAEESGFFATIGDTGFLENIQKGVEAFREGDVLECIVRTKQRKVGTQLRAEHEIVQVTKHIAATEQLNIDRELDSDAAAD